MIPELGTPGLVGQYRNCLLSRIRARGATAYCPFSCFGGNAYCPTAYCPAPVEKAYVRTFNISPSTTTFGMP